MPEFLLVITTLPDHASAEQLAGRIVESGLAACVNIGARVTSIYMWQGAIERGEEHLLTIKTTRDRYPALQDAIVSGHPYELPEVIAVPIETGLSQYLAWIESCTKS